MADDALIVPEPEPPDSPDAWYTSGIHDHYEIVPGVVATVADGESGFTYRIREPSLSARALEDLRAMREHFADAQLRRPGPGRAQQSGSTRGSTGNTNGYSIGSSRAPRPVAAASSTTPCPNCGVSAS